MDTRELFRTVRQLVRSISPDLMPSEIVIRLVSVRGECSPIRLPVPAAPAKRERRTFVPTPFQQAILDALDGKAMTTDQLAAVLQCDRRRIFTKPRGGMEELKNEGLVENMDRLGYYRPDAPPPQLSTE